LDVGDLARSDGIRWCAQIELTKSKLYTDDVQGRFGSEWCVRGLEKL